jgi:hypothetical protein
VQTPAIAPGPKLQWVTGAQPPLDAVTIQLISPSLVTYVVQVYDFSYYFLYPYLFCDNGY